MADLQCPLAPHVIDLLPLQNRMNLSRVMEIEQHVKSAGPCIHPPLADLVLHGSYDGSSPLLLACQEGHLDAVKHVVEEWGADLMAQDNHGFTPILRSAESVTFNVLDFLLESDKIDRKDKIDAMELAGAKLILSPDPDDHERAERYWKKALVLRQEPNPINKIPLHITSQSAVEWVTLEELEGVIQNPSLYWRQAIVTRLRIYSSVSCKAVQEFIKSEFSYGFFKDSDDYYYVVEEAPKTDHIEDLLIETLGVFLSLEDPYGPMLWELTQKLIDELTESLEDDGPLTDIELERISTSLQLILRADPDGRIKYHYGFFKMLSSQPGVFLSGDVRKCASPSARLDDGILLTTACEKQDWKTLRLLLHLGAHPTTSVYGNGALHIVAGQGEGPSVLSGEREEYTPAQLLFNYGANPYAINHDGKTAVQIWIEKNCGVEGMQSTAWSHRPQWCRDTVPKLSSLTAKTIHIHGINYSHPGKVPVDCLRLLENH